MSETPVTLITGGGSGIGAAAAIQLLEQGHRVAVMGRSEDRLRRFAERAGAPDRLLTIAGNAADWDTVSAAVAETVRRFGRLDGAVANAGYATFDGIVDGDPAGWPDMVLTNVLGPALLIRAAIDELRRTRGRIVLVGSVAGVRHTANNLYGATKWAVTALAENTRQAVTADGVGVTLVSPGRVETPFWDGGAPGDKPDGDMLTADQVGGAIAWALTQPSGVDVSAVTVRPVGQPT